MMVRRWNEQERRRLIMAAAVAGFVLLVLLLVIPYVRALGRGEERQRRAGELLSELRRVEVEVAELRAALRRGAGGSLNTSATALVESSAATLGLRDRLISLRPQVGGEQGDISESLEVAFERVSLEELVRWLFALENASGGQQLHQLRMRKRFDDPEMFDVTLQLVRYRTEGR